MKRIARVPKFAAGMLAAFLIVVAMGASSFFDVLNAPDGDATDPAYSFNDDSDTGMFRSGGNQLNFSAGGTSRLQVDASGDVVEVTGAFSASGNVTAATIDTGQGAYEIHAQDQDVRTTDDVQFDDVQFDLLQFTDATELTIATGSITATNSYHAVDTESDAASDDLDTINGGTAGDLLWLRPGDGTRTVVVKNGTGNIVLDADVSLDDATDTIALLFDGTNWLQVGGSAQGGGGGGETNTASNLGAGVGVYETKSGVDLQFNSLVASNAISVTEDDGNDEIDIAVSDDAVLPGTGGITLPTGTTGERPAGVGGELRFNSTTGTIEGYSGGDWTDLGGGGGGSWVLIESQVATSESSLDFVTGIGSTYDLYVMLFSNVTLSADGGKVTMRTSSDTGMTFDSGSTDYKTALYGHYYGAALSTSSSNLSYINLVDNVGNDTGEHANGEVYIFSPDESTHTIVHFRTNSLITDGEQKFFQGMGRRLEAGIVDAVQVLPSSGTFSGRFSLYGIAY